MVKFFFSIAAGSQRLAIEALEPPWPYILASYAGRRPQLPRYHEYELMIDCGGFSQMKLNGGYTIDDRAYLAYIQEMNPANYILRDYPCEPQVLREHGRTVRQHIEMTVDHHIRLLELHDRLGVRSNPVPVIQGWKIADYLHAIDRLREQGLVRGYMGIGTLCRRGSQRGIAKVVRAVNAELPRVKLHGFGVKITALKEPGVWSGLYSVDSGAYGYTARHVKLRDGDSATASLSDLRRHVQRIQRLKQWHKGQTTLRTFKGEAP
jgi:hypothetical protein